MNVSWPRGWQKQGGPDILSKMTSNDFNLLTQPVPNRETRTSDVDTKEQMLLSAVVFPFDLTHEMLKTAPRLSKIGQTKQNVNHESC